MNSYQRDDFQIECIFSDRITELNSFHVGEKEVDNFIQRHYLSYLQEKRTIGYFVKEKESGEIVCFFTLNAYYRELKHGENGIHYV